MTGNDSDYDVLAIDERGRPCSAVTAATPCGVVAEVYRSCLRVQDRAGWRQGCHAPYPVVLTTRSGSFTYQDLHVRACTGPQEGVYAACWYADVDGMAAMAAVGVWGFDADGYVGVLPGSMRYLADIVASWARDGDVPGVFASLNFEQALRYNQGDYFLACGAGFQVEATPPGSANIPMIYRGVTCNLPQGGVTS